MVVKTLKGVLRLCLRLWLVYVNSILQVVDAYELVVLQILQPLWRGIHWSLTVLKLYGWSAFMLTIIMLLKLETIMVSATLVTNKDEVPVTFNLESNMDERFGTPVFLFYLLHPGCTKVRLFD